MLKELTDPGGGRNIALGAPTFITGLQVVLNRGGERLINLPLLSESVPLTLFCHKTWAPVIFLLPK